MNHYILQVNHLIINKYLLKNEAFKTYKKGVHKGNEINMMALGMYSCQREKKLKRKQNY